MYKGVSTSLKVLTAGVILAATTVPASTAEACKIERATTVCKQGERTLRVIRKSGSPSGRYAVAWATRETSPPGAKYEDSPSGAVTVHDADVDNFLVELPVGKS